MTTAPTPPTTTRLRVLPAPPADPPYDDEAPAGTVRTDGALALAFPPTHPPLLPLRLVPPAGPPAAGDGPAGPLPPARPWAARIVQAVLDVLTGTRAAAQLSRFASLEVLQQLERASARWAPRPGTAVRRPVVVSVHVCTPVPGVAEAAAVVDTGRRRRAVAVRLEARDGRWECRALQLG